MPVEIINKEKNPIGYYFYNQMRMLNQVVKKSTSAELLLIIISMTPWWRSLSLDEQNKIIKKVKK